MRTFTFLLTITIIISCKKSNYDSEFNRIKYDNESRDYLLQVPDSYDENAPIPLVIALHGGTGSAKNIEEQSGLAVFARENGFILCSPNGYKRTWNAGWCCGKSNKNDIDDVGFIGAVIDEIESEYNIDPTRIYATGMSNGGMMSYRLACELSDRIAAIAPVAGGMVLPNCTPSNAVSVVHFHSYQDDNVPWDGGTGNGISDHYNAPLDSIADVFASMNNCKSDTTYSIDQDVDVWEWSSCDDSTSVIFYFTNDGGHSWPLGAAPTRNADEPSNSINANEVMWEFFLAHPKR